MTEPNKTEQLRREALEGTFDEDGDLTFFVTPSFLLRQNDTCLRIVGQLHAPTSDGYPCHCGCQFVDGLVGSRVEDADTSKLATLDPPLLYASFEVPNPFGGQSRCQIVAYSYAELGLTS